MGGCYHYVFSGNAGMLVDAFSCVGNIVLANEDNIIGNEQTIGFAV